MNIIDRTISFFDPQAGLKRHAARTALQMARSYDGAMGGRRTQNWAANNASANASIKGPLPLLRARSRDLMRNTWWGARIQSVYGSHAVGAGVTPVFKTGNKTLDRRAAAAWREWGAACDAEGQLDINGLINLATKCVIESGEVLARMRVSNRRDLRVPLELQLLEPDHLDPSRDRFGPDKFVFDGIEYDKSGKRAAYWIWPVHPGERGIVVRFPSVSVPAADMLHMYRKDRIGQGRGVPWLAPVLLKGRDAADLEEAIVVKGRIEACLAAFIKSNNPGTTLAAKAAIERGADGGGPRRIEELSPGMIAYLEQGEELQTVSPSSSLQFESVLMMNWLALAAGAGITYDQLTGDLRRANYSSLRAGKIEFRRGVEQFQFLTLVAMLLNPLVRRWGDLAQDFGVLPRRAGGYPVEWIMPAVEPIDPLKDMEADIMAVRSGRMTWHNFVAAWGVDPDEQMDNIAAWFKDLDARKIVLDTDPRVALASTKGGAREEASTEVNTDVKKPKPKD